MTSVQRCTRIPYASRGDANRAAKRGPKFHVYTCERCGQFHLTSKTKREIKAAAQLRNLVNEAAEASRASSRSRSGPSNR